MGKLLGKTVKLNLYIPYGSDIPPIQPKETQTCILLIKTCTRMSAYGTATLNRAAVDTSQTASTGRVGRYTEAH